MEGLAAPAVAVAPAFAGAPAVASAVIPANAGIQFAVAVVFAVVPAAFHSRMAGQAGIQLFLLVIPANAGIHFDFAWLWQGAAKNKGNSKLDPGLTSHPAVESRRDDGQKQQAGGIP